MLLVTKKLFLSFVHAFFVNFFDIWAINCYFIVNQTNKRGVNGKRNRKNGRSWLHQIPRRSC